MNSDEAVTFFASAQGRKPKPLEKTRPQLVRADAVEWTQQSFAS